MPKRTKGTLHISVASMVSAEQLEPGVSLTIDGHSWDIPVEKAREVAAMMVEASYAAESDAFLIDYMAELMDSEPRRAAPILADFRAWREKRGGR